MSHIHTFGAAVNMVPDFGNRQRLVAEDLRRLDEPCVLFEHHGVDSDGVDFYVYTVAGWLDGHRLADGCTVGGEAIIVHAGSRQEADAIASLGLMDTIAALDREEEMYQEANAAMARLSAIGARERLEQTLKPDADKSDAFMEDVAKVRPLAGDDVILTVGTVASGPH